MSFLLNNPVILIIIITAIACVGYFGWLLYREISLNRLLNVKHQSMRLHRSDLSTKKRFGYLSIATVSPVMILLIAFIIGINKPGSPVGNPLSFSSQEDVIDVYENFQKRSSSNDLESEDDYSPVSEDPVPDEDYVASPGSEGEFFPDLVTDKANIYVNTSDGNFDYSAEGLLITSVIESDSEIPSDKSGSYVMSDLISCGSDYDITGVYVDDIYFVTISKQIDTTCTTENIDTSASVIHVFDKLNDFNLLSEVVVNGDITGMHSLSEDLIITTRNQIDFTSQDASLDMYLPYYEINDSKVIQAYDDIIYIEGVSPTSFISVYALNVENESVSLITLLADSEFDIYTSNQKIYAIGNVFEFEPLSDFVDYEDPVNDKSVIILQIEYIDDELVHTNTDIK